MRKIRILKTFHLLFILFASCVQYTGSVGGFQRFVVTPESVQVREGEDVTLQCVVEDQQGRAQWTKDGFALGFQRHVPGYPHFAYLGDPEGGQHHLLISSVSITDDGEYQCQVGPTLTNPPIWAAANLTVLLAPTGISLEGHKNGSVLEMAVGDRFALRCMVSDAHPPPSLSWHKAGHQVDPAQVESYVVESNLPYRWSIRSQLVGRVKAQDDGERVSCTAVHPALDEGSPLMASLKLSVQHPPGQPVISGYKTGDVLIAGEHRTLICRAPGGNPRPWVLWYREGGHLLDDSYSRDASGTLNALQLGVTTATNGERYECRVGSDSLEHPLSASVTLTVHYPPSLVSLTGSSWLEVGGSVALQCEATESNPPATISWLVKGEAVGSPAAAVVKKGSGGGWVTQSKFVWQQHGRENQVLVECRTEHPTLRDPLRKTMLLTVTKPVGAPEFEGDPSKEILAGTSLDLICSLQRSGPTPSISIFKNGRLVPTELTHEDRESRAKGVLEVTAADNGSEVSCEVTSPASETPKIASTTLTVLFPPHKVTASTVAKMVEEGSVVNITCKTSSSSPAAEVTWVSEGILLKGAISSSSPSTFGGFITRSELQVKTTAADNGRTYSCEASNGFGSNVRDEITLNVLHAPVWIERPSSLLVAREGSQLVIRAKASANPGPVRYWWKRGSEVLVGAGGELRLGLLTKDLTGNYTVSAYSRRGAVNASFHLNVQYGPDEIEAPERVTVEEGDSVNLQCSAKGDPTPHLSWTRRNRTLATGVGSARLMLTYVRRNDTGVYYCRARSSLDVPPPVATRLIVTQPAEVLQESPRRFWAALGGEGRLVCLFRASPAPSFAWSTEEGHEIQNGEKYIVRRSENVDDLALWRSVLEVRSIAGGDYGLYRCSASNALGSESSLLTLIPPKRPNKPSNLTVLNVSNGSVVLKWSPEGKDLSFTVRYRAEGTLLYQYLDVPEGGPAQARVKGLSPGMSYNFSIQARSEQGSSDFTVPPVTVTTLGERVYGTEETTYRITSLLMLVIVLSAMALLVLNAAVITCILRRNKRRNNSIRSSSTKTTSLATHNSPTSSPEDHQHHHEHHHVIMPLGESSPKVGREPNKRVKHTVLACPASPGKKGSAGKSTTKPHVPYMSNGRIPQASNHKASKKNDSQNRASGTVKASKKGRFHSLIIPEACSLIPKNKENRKSNHSEEDDEQASVSSHDSVDTAIFCSSEAARSFSPSGELQEPSQAPQNDDPPSLQNTEEEEESSQEYQQEDLRQQLQQEIKRRNLPKQAMQRHSVTRLSDLRQYQHYHTTYTPGGPGQSPSCSPRHSSPANTKPFHSSPTSPNNSRLYHPPPQSPRRTPQQSPESPSRFLQHRQQVRLQASHQLPPSPGTKAHNTPLGSRVHYPPQNSPRWSQERRPIARTPPTPPSPLQNLPRDSSPSRGFVSGESPTRNQRILPSGSPTRVQHRPPPVPPKRSIQNRPQTHHSPHLRRKYTPDEFERARSSQASPQQRYSVPPSPRALPHSPVAPNRTFHHEFPYFELIYPPDDTPNDAYPPSNHSSQRKRRNEGRQLPSALPGAVRGFRDYHSPMATSSLIRNSRKPRFPDDYLWQGGTDKL